MNATNNVIRMAGRRQRVVQSVVEEEVGRERERGGKEVCGMFLVGIKRRVACN